MKISIRGILLCVIVALLYAGLIYASGGNSLCHVRILTGLPCPGCGLRSAFNALCAGDLYASLKFHPFLLTLPFLAIILLFRAHPKIAPIYANRYLWIAYFVALFGFYIVRLCAFFPNGPYPMVWIHDCIIVRLYEALSLLL